MDFYLYLFIIIIILTKEILWCQSFKQSNTDFGQNQGRCVLPRWKWYPPVTLAQNPKTLFSFLHFGGRNGHSPVFEGHPKSHFPRRRGKWNSQNSNYGLESVYPRVNDLYGGRRFTQKQTSFLKFSQLSIGPRVANSFKTTNGFIRQNQLPVYTFLI